LFLDFSIVTMNMMEIRTAAGMMFGVMVLCGGCASHRAENPKPNLLMRWAWSIPLSNTAPIEMSWISSGTFIMGSPTFEPFHKADESPQTQVTLTKGFWLGKTMVTIKQWKGVMGLDVRGQLSKMLNDGTLYDLGSRKQTVRDFMRFSRDADPGQYLANEDDNLPMYFVSWNDTMEFCKILNARERAAGRLPKGYEFNLPTEAQWEYACRAGTTDATYAGPLIVEGRRAPVLDNIAWYNANSPDDYTGNGFNVSGRKGGPRPVAQKQPNAWGLYDMEGDIWEWCRDWYGPYPGGSLPDPNGLATGTDRVNRGGSFGSGMGDERSANRAKNPPAEASAYRGFRLALCPVP
jgi:formylglycine-generating enzyme required for sulfatase activity